MEAWRIADLHGYVDDCLEPDERLAFEREMAEDPALARRAALWRGQNSAIRSAFDREGAKPFAISLVRAQSEPFGKPRRAAAVGGKPSSDAQAPLSSPTIADASRLSPETVAPETFRSPFSWRLGLAALAVALAFLWSPAATTIPAKGLAEVSVAAFRAFTRPGVEPVEFETGNAAEAQAWLTPRLMHPVYLPVTPSAVRLVGARIAPFPGAPAAFLIYKSQGGLIGLLIQALDAPRTRAPGFVRADGGRAVVWTWRGQGLALAGDAEAASLIKLAADFLGPSDEDAQAAPDRGL